MRRVAWLGYTVYLLLGWSSVLIPSLVVAIERSFQRTDAAIGLVYLLGALLYAGGALGGGLLAERFGARTVLLAALCILATGLFVQGWAQTWALFLAAAALGQSGSGAGSGGVQALFLEWFPDSRGGALNRLHLFFGLGALCGPATVGVILSLGLNWRPILVGSGAVLLVVAMAVIALPRAMVGMARVSTPEPASPVSTQERSLRPFLWLAISIACYEAATIGVSSWLVRFLSDEPVRLATGALSLYWAGICLVRLMAPWLTPRVPATALTLVCLVSSSVALAVAILVPWMPLALVLVGVTGVFVGPIYPMLIVIGGDLYPRRLAALSGGLTAAATIGAIIYPPLMGVVADQVGLKVGLLGAAFLGLPAAVALLLATGATRFGRVVQSEITAGRANRRHLGSPPDLLSPPKSVPTGLASVRHVSSIIARCRGIVKEQRSPTEGKRMTEFRHRVQRNWGPRVREIEYLGMPLVNLENERLRAGVLAGKGADVVEFNYKPRDLDFVWLTPGGVRNPAAFLSTSPDPLATFVDTYPGGWQEVFPNGGAPASYFGAQFGQHGEVSNLPWDAQVVEDSEAAVSVTFRTRTLKTPFHLQKSLRLAAGEPTISFAESITNESDVELPAMWGYHLAYGRPFLDQTCRIRLPDGVTVIPHLTAIHPDGRRVVANQRPSWPFAKGTDGGTVDLSTLPPRGTISEIVYLTDFPEGWYELEHPGKGIGIRVEWDISVMPYLWYWMEFGASKAYPWYGRLYTIGLEPFSSYPTNGLPDAVANGSALRFGAREQKDYWLRATIYETRDRQFNGVDTRG